MTSLENNFERKLREAALDKVEHEVVGKRDNLVHQFVQEAHDRLRAYGERHDYDVEPVIDSLAGPEVTRTERRLEVRIGWDHPAAPYFEFGTSDHTIQGEPVLSFVWEDPPDWVATEFEPEGDGYRVFLPEVEVDGLPKSRFIRDALEWLRREVS